MAHFAKIDKNNLVIEVCVTDNDAPNEGLDFLKSAFGGTWIKTSYNTFEGQHLVGGVPLRKNFAGIGYTYDKTKDAFIPPQPFPSWVLDEEKCVWFAPKPEPLDEQQNSLGAYWDEEKLDWVLSD